MPDSSAGTAILWFRRDLRLADNPALVHALGLYTQVLPLYIHDEKDDSGAASLWWLHQSLIALQAALKKKGSVLLIRSGEPLAELRKLIADSGATAVFWNRLYEPAAIKRDVAIKQALLDSGIDCKSFNAALLIEPWQLQTAAGGPYQVFTPFWKACQRQVIPAQPLPESKRLPAIPAKLSRGSIDELKLLPKIDWYRGFEKHWMPGEAGARARLDKICDSIVRDYPDHRDFPGRDGTTRLSPHLHFGEISPRQINAVLEQLHVRGHSLRGIESVRRQLGWREFAHHLLFHFPATPTKPLREKYTTFPWRKRYTRDLARWQRGNTGIPIIDAGMRQLWAAGWMHNRVRMLVASFLCKNLLIPWQEGAHWFWDTLLDADLANNTMGWQWVAGCGADAAPYFRIFNPLTQGQRFDPDGIYLRTWLPELGKLSAEKIHQPWTASPAELNTAGVRLGIDYPEPMVDLKGSREAAIDAYKKFRSHAKAQRRKEKLI